MNRILVVAVLFALLFMPVWALMRRLLGFLCRKLSDPGMGEVRRLRRAQSDLVRGARRRTRQAAREKEDAEKVIEELKSC